MNASAAASAADTLSSAVAYYYDIVDATAGDRQQVGDAHVVAAAPNTAATDTAA